MFIEKSADFRLILKLILLAQKAGVERIEFKEEKGKGDKSNLDLGIMKNEREPKRQKGRKAERQKGRKGERQRGRKVEMQKGRKAERQKGRKGMAERENGRKSKSRNAER
jgi:hypothetical protein